MRLYLDTSDNQKTVVGIDGKRKIYRYESAREQNVLGAISETFKKQKITIADITSVEVVTGPGSFTGLRVGVSIVNALSYALKVSVNGRPAGSLIMPTYGKKPNIQSR